MKIKSINALGLSFTDESGPKRIDYQELPQEMRDYYQFGEEEAEAARARELEIEKGVADRIKKGEAKAEIARPNRREQDPVVDSVDRVEILTLRQQISVMEARLTGLESELGNARSRARGSGRSRSAPGSLETWDERASRLARVKVRAELQLAQLQDRLWVIDESYREERKR